MRQEFALATVGDNNEALRTMTLEEERFLPPRLYVKTSTTVSSEHRRFLVSWIISVRALHQLGFTFLNCTHPA